MRKITVGNKYHSMELDTILLGSNKFGTKMDLAQSCDRLDFYFDTLGGKTIDTATIYGERVPGDSASEKTIGEWLKGRKRENVLIISKGCCFKQTDPGTPRVTPEALKEDLDQSLAALGTDYIDLFLLHRDNRNVPVGPLMDLLEDYTRQGVIRAAGVSNWWTDRIAEANRYCDEHGYARMCVSEIQWSYVPQTPGNEMGKNENNGWMNASEFMAYKENEIPVLAWSSQALGYIPKVLSGADPGPMGAHFDSPLSRARAKRAQHLAEELGVTPTQISVAYLLCSGIAAGAIVGASSNEQLRESFASADIALSDAQMDYLNDDLAAGE